MNKHLSLPHQCTVDIVNRLIEVRIEVFLRVLTYDKNKIMALFRLEIGVAKSKDMRDVMLLAQVFGHGFIKTRVE